MGLLDALFGGGAPQPLSKLRERVARLTRSGEFKQALRELERHRHAADRHFEDDSTEQFYQNGIAHYLALEPCLELARGHTGRAQYEYLKAFYASYVALHLTLPRIRDKVSADRKELIEQHMHHASNVYTSTREEFDPDICEEADTEANELFSRRY